MSADDKTVEALRRTKDLIQPDHFIMALAQYYGANVFDVRVLIRRVVASGVPLPQATHLESFIELMIREAVHG